MHKPLFAGLILIFLCGLYTSRSLGQSLDGYTGNPCSFNTYTQILNPCTATEYVALQYNFGNTNKAYTNWSLRVKATNFSNGVNSLSPQYVSLRFNRVSANGPSASEIGVSPSPVTLRTSNVTLINQSPSSLGNPNYYTEHKFDLIIQGGAHLLLSTGTYTSTLTFSLYDRNNKLLASKDIQVSFVINYNTSCSGVRLGAYTSSQSSFDTYNELMAGTTDHEYVTVQYIPGGSNCTGWTLKVRTTGSFTNGTNQVDPGYFSLRFNRVSTGSPSANDIGVSYAPVALSTSDVTLIDHAKAPFSSYTEHKFDFIIQGGNHLLLPTNGSYSTTLVFTLYNESGQVISTYNTPATFQINTDVNNTYSILLQNAADLISLNISSPADLINGVSVSKPTGLKITGYRPYQVIVKTTGNNLTSASSPSLLPVSTVKLQIAAPSSLNGIICNTFSLSPLDQIFISNPLYNHNYQTVQYSLRYYTEPMDARLTTVPAGIYTTSVLFVIIPQ